jgi:hypothetical protein
MKIEIEIGDGNVGQSVQEILATLGSDDRKALAREVITKWLADTLHTNEREVKESEVIAKIQTNNQSSSYKRDETVSEIRTSYAFRELMNTWKSSRDIMVGQIGAEVANYYKEQVKAVVEGDPTLQRMREEVGKLVVELFPKMVHDAVTAWFGIHIETIVRGAMQASIQLPEISKFQEQVAQRLGQIR